MERFVAPPSPMTSSSGPSDRSGEATPLDEAHAAAVSDELAVALYEQMVVARELDDRLVALQREGRIISHSSAAGEEAAIVGAAAALRDEDWVFLAGREMAAALWRGMPLAACAHHLFGTARSAGKGRNVHGSPFWKPTRVASVSPLSGTHIPHAVGVAWAARVRREDVAALVFFGEGATSSGDFHTGLNFAGVTKAPVLAVCRNNGWATSTPSSRQTASDGFAVKALAYGMRGVRVDGGDVTAVLGVVREARARASNGEGGTLIEAVTTPRSAVDAEGTPAVDASVSHAADAAHVMRTRSDPIARMRRHLESRGLTSAESDERLAAEVRADVERALAEASNGALPTSGAWFDDVYASPPWHLREQRAELEGLGERAGRAATSGARP
jgi:pyruvate dehydrogenase E1 component alpha subunit